MSSEKARIVCRRVSALIHEAVPAGLGHWGPAWTFVADPSDVFMDALAEWEAEESPSTRSGLQGAIADLLKAWKAVARRWKEMGSPPLPEPEQRAAVKGAVEELVS